MRSDKKYDPVFENLLIGLRFRHVPSVRVLDRTRYMRGEPVESMFIGHREYSQFVLFQIRCRQNALFVGGNMGQISRRSEMAKARNSTFCGRLFDPYNHAVNR